MGFNTTNGFIEKFFIDNYDGFTPVEINNVKLKRPTTNKWVKLTILNGGQFQNGFNGRNNQYRKSGLVIVSIFIKQGGGTAEADEIADVIEKFMRGAHYENITFYSPELNTIGESGKWFQKNLTTPFKIDEIA